MPFTMQPHTPEPSIWPHVTPLLPLVAPARTLMDGQLLCARLRDTSVLARMAEASGNAGLQPMLRRGAEAAAQQQEPATAHPAAPPANPARSAAGQRSASSVRRTAQQQGRQQQQQQQRGGQGARSADAAPAASGAAAARHGEQPNIVRMVLRQQGDQWEVALLNARGSQGSDFKLCLRLPQASGKFAPVIAAMLLNSLHLS